MKFKNWKGEKVEYKEVKSAKGVKGFLIDSPFDGPFFRVYDKVNLDEHGKWTIIDYPIAHSDLEIEIVDEEAAFYHKENGVICLDYSPATLGMKETEE